jgi:hypothetical protein
MSMKQVFCAFAWFAILAVSTGVHVYAQTGSGNGTQGQIDLLLKRIEELEALQKQMQQRMDLMMTHPAAATPAGPSAETVAPPPRAPSVPVAESVAAVGPEAVSTDTASDPGMHTLGPVQFSGFTDFSYGRAVFENLPPGGLSGSSSGFGIGDVDLFTNTRIAENWSLLAELLFTSDFTNQISADIDRLMLTYRPTDFFNISIGKFNTAIGYYPNAFHRADYFQIATGRPIMYSDEDAGGILPVHSIGVTTTGKIPAGTLGLHWVAEISNGTGSNALSTFPIQNFADENSGKAVNFALYAKPEWLPGLQFGGSVYRDTLHPQGYSAVNQINTAAHIVYVGTKFHWLNEAAVVRHSLAGTDQVFRSLTSYSEISRKFGKNTPYVRFDYQNVPKSDPIFGALSCQVGEQCNGGRRSGPSLGVNRRLSEYVIIKVQYGRLGQRAVMPVNDFQVQLAIAF